MNPVVVAVDGPAGSGKSSVSVAAAERLGYAFLDTGAAYRALTWLGLERGVDLTDARAVVALLAEFHYATSAGADGTVVRVGDADVTSAGRHPNADIFLDDVTVSRRHAEFTRRGTAFEVRDLGSLNGTYYDGVRIESALLSDSAEVQIGKFRLTFYASRQDLAAAANG